MMLKRSPLFGQWEPLQFGSWVLLQQDPGSPSQLPCFLGQDAPGTSCGSSAPDLKAAISPKSLDSSQWEMVFGNHDLDTKNVRCHCLLALPVDKARTFNNKMLYELILHIQFKFRTVGILFNLVLTFPSYQYNQSFTLFHSRYKGSQIIYANTAITSDIKKQSRMFSALLVSLWCMPLRMYNQITVFHSQLAEFLGFFLWVMPTGSMQLDSLGFLRDCLLFI